VTVHRVHSVDVMLPDSRIVKAELIVERLPSRDWTLVASYPDGPQLSVSGSDLFECLRSLNRKTEEQGIRVLCNGSRRDAWPSGMLRDMTGASKVYITSMGRTATPLDLVPIFGAASADLVGTVEEQDTYHNEWLRSLKNAAK